MRATATSLSLATLLCACTGSRPASRTATDSGGEVQVCSLQRRLIPHSAHAVRMDGGFQEP
jgi:hypothetical protein